jgi:stage V sporulation protein B
MHERDVAAAERESEEAARAGRGVLFTMSAKAIFIASGFVVQLLLPRILDAAAWGRYSTVATITAILTNTLVAATVQTVSKRTSENDASADRAQREGLTIGLALAVLLGGGFASAAPWLAGSWQREESLAPLFVTASVVIASYAMYAALIGSINGRRRFGEQAAFDMGFAILRASGIVTGALIGAALGAIAGFALAAVIILLVALARVGTGQGPLRPSVGPWLAFFVPIAAYQACLNGILQIDQPILRSLLARSLEPDEASRIAGYYRAAQTFAFVPYQLILAVTFIVFPTVSRATSAGDDEATRRAIRGAMRFSLIVLLMMAAPIAGASDGVMRIAYPEEYLAGAPALAVLGLGMVAFSLFAIAASILAGAGHARTIAGIALGAVALVIGGNVIAVGGATPGIDATIAAAAATSLGATMALLAAGTAVYLRFRAFLPILSAVRATTAAAVGFAIARFVPHTSAPGALAACALGAVGFLVALALTRELGAADFALIRRVLRAGRSS